MLEFKVVVDPGKKERYAQVLLSEEILLGMPHLNKGSAFTLEERKSFGLLGRLPHRVESIDEQVERIYSQYKCEANTRGKSIFLSELYLSNQTLFYKFVQTHLVELLPVIYTPEVAVTVKNYSQDFRHPAGLYISYPNRNDIASILQNRPFRDIDLIVVTDGERILGIGDQGVGGVQISIAKSMLYTLFGGVSPLRILPIVLDVGTCNEQLLNDPFYLGWRHKRVRGVEYDTFIGDFISALQNEFFDRDKNKMKSGILLHWEDFGRDNALKNLARFRESICSFNDDIQGTAVVTVAALLFALNKKKQKLSEQRIVIFGAGSAGCGIADLIGVAMEHESSIEGANNVWLIDKEGLITEDSQSVTPMQKRYARKSEEIINWCVADSSYISLKDVVAHVKPTILLGCSGVASAFTEEIIKMQGGFVDEPIIFLLSNPKEKCEALPQDVIMWTFGKVLLATGSPFDLVKFNNEEYHITQCNNALSFPGIGLGVVVAKAEKVTSGMLWAATFALFNYAVKNVREHRLLLPAMVEAGEVAKEIALAVAKQAVCEGVALIDEDSDILTLIDDYRWHPEYLTYRTKKHTRLEIH